MKAKVRRARRIRKSISKMINLLLIAGILFFVGSWLYQRHPGIARYFSRFGEQRIDATEPDLYYDLLTKHAHPGKGLILNLGIKEGDDLQLAVNRLKGVMGLEGYTIWLAHHDAAKPPAYIKQLSSADMGILISNKVTERREHINLLTHELGHIYVWRLDPKVFGKCDQEKLVDCSGAFLGLGVLILNGMTDESVFMPGSEYETRKKTYGYFKPEQFGYLLARYCRERGIEKDNVDRFLLPAGKKYFDAGWAYLNKTGHVSANPDRDVAGIYWCPKCGYAIQIPLTGKISDVKCPKCGN